MRHSLWMSVGLSLLLCHSAMASSATMQDLLQPGATIQSGDKLFYDFHDFLPQASGGATPVDPALVFVSSYWNSQIGEYGLLFESAGFVVGPGQTQDTLFSFRVRAATEGGLLSDNTLTMAGSQEQGGYAFIIENVVTPDETSLLAHEMTAIYPGGSVLLDHKEFPQAFADVHIRKDIALVGGNGTARVDSFTQTFSPIPEPLTLTASAMGVLALAGYIRRTYGRHAATE